VITLTLMLAKFEFKWKICRAKLCRNLTSAWCNFLPLTDEVGCENCRKTKANVVGDDDSRVSFGNYDSHHHPVWSSESKSILKIAESVWLGNLLS